MTDSRPPRLRSFLLRCWEEVSDSQDAGSVWRFSLEEPGGKRLGFANLESLTSFLDHEFRQSRQAGFQE